MDTRTSDGLLLLTALSLFCASVAWTLDRAVFALVFAAQCRRHFPRRSPESPAMMRGPDVGEWPQRRHPNAYGYEPTRQAGMAAFANSWRRER
jgi:hypothetical protein